MADKRAMSWTVKHRRRWWLLQQQRPRRRQWRWHWRQWRWQHQSFWRRQRQRQRQCWQQQQRPQWQQWRRQWRRQQLPRWRQWQQLWQRHLRQHRQRWLQWQRRCLCLFSAVGNGNNGTQFIWQWSLIFCHLCQPCQLVSVDSRWNGQMVSSAVVSSSDSFYLQNLVYWFSVAKTISFC